MGLFSKLKEGLAKTRSNIVSGFNNIFSSHKAIDDEFYEDLEEIMIMGDMGVRATDEILEDLKSKVKEQKIKEPQECRQLLIDSIKEKMYIGENEYAFETEKSVVLVIGVNGVGKTTSVGKLASKLKAQGEKVMLAAADTFRAGAIEQLKVWSKRAGVEVIAQSEGSDPAAVVFDSLQAYKARNIDVLIADTAGRLHNKKNLMNELSKINRVIDREAPGVHRENLIVLDATTGQNAIAQLKEFNDVSDITGIILTKMDGTAKGGIVVAIQSEFGIPVKYIGVGEKVEDLQKFDSNSFVEALFDTDNIDDDDEEMVGIEATEFSEESEEVYGEELTSEEFAEIENIAGFDEVDKTTVEEIQDDIDEPAVKESVIEEVVFEESEVEQAEDAITEEVENAEEIITEEAEEVTGETTDNSTSDSFDDITEESEQTTEEVVEEEPKKKRGFFGLFKRKKSQENEDN